MIELKPITETTAYEDEITRRILALFTKEFYRPLMKELGVNKKTLKNAPEDLIDAIRSGRITYHKGIFSGKLNATLSQELRKLGAKWNGLEKAFSLPVNELPLEVRHAISASEFRFTDMLRKIDKKLSEIWPAKLADQVKVEDLFDKTIFKLNKKFEDSVKSITIAPKFDDAQRKRLASEYQEDLKRPIKDFTSEQIEKLRKQIRASAEAGNRFETLQKSIQESYGVTVGRARFIARQETNLVTAKFTEMRYQAAGVTEYKWRSVTGSKAHPVRPAHQALNDASQKQGKVFRFDDPPITSEPGEAVRRNNPKQDFNCRCTAVPIVRGKK